LATEDPKFAHFALRNIAKLVFAKNLINHRLQQFPCCGAGADTRCGCGSGSGSELEIQQGRNFKTLFNIFFILLFPVTTKNQTNKFSQLKYYFFVI
jgi:hypothetical protein